MSCFIVDQGEKLSLKETLTLLDGAARHNVQVLIIDSGQRTGTGSALMAMKDAGVNTYRWQGGEQRPATIISEPDRNVRYARLAGDFAVSVKAGEESVAQVSGVREQAMLTQTIRSELKTQGVLGHPEVTMTALSPVWLDSRSRYLRDMYRPGMVMEQWNPETRSHDRYVIDRVAGLVMTVLTVGLVSCAGKSLPRFWPGDFFPTFYACHLAVLGVLAL
ncbi:TPA: traI domain protein [Escherichia coli]|nr:traI domain protein [Escherichia coli]HAM6539705.1 traI domain protein [Escherichia coli]